MKDTKFSAAVRASRSGPLRAMEIATLQVNVGYRCTLACKHCHIAGGPTRTEMMERSTADAVLAVLSGSGIATIDITGGAPELNPHVRHLVIGARSLGKQVIVRTNLAVFADDGRDGFPEFYRDHDVELVASLPYYKEDTVDRVRGDGTFRKCIAALRRLNGLGYGTGIRRLNLVYNPPGAFLAPGQAALELAYRKELSDRFRISFDRLFTFTNMPIGRFREFLVHTGNLGRYQDTLERAFNPATLDNIMCRHLLSVGWDGRLFDCDFNQAVGIPVGSGAPSHISAFDHAALARRTIETGDHCFGCTAGAGSS